jgi:signal transduction histidine kinase
MEQVSKPFYRVERSRSRNAGGADLGLAVARTIVRGHGGNIAFQPVARRPATDGHFAPARLMQ